MARRRFLPKYVSAFPDRHGKTRHRFRKAGSIYSGRYFQSTLGTEEFREEYALFLSGKPLETDKPAPSKYPKGSIGDLMHRYMAVPTRLGPTAVTQQKVGAVIQDFCKGRETRQVAHVRFEHLEAIIAKKQVKTFRDTKSGPRPIGGYHAAVKLRKELIRLFAFAQKAGMIDHNPAAETEKVKKPRGKSGKGFKEWTEQEIAKYRSYWAIGTRERLAMELLLWTDQRRCDVVKMGMAQTRDGFIPVTQEKTGKTLWIAMAPQLIEAIIALPPEHSSPFCFLITHKGAPFKKASFGNWFAKACDKAGLPKECRAHGLRKAMLRRMADLGMSNKTMKSVSGQERDETLAEYIRAADQKALAASAIEQISAWENQRKCLTSSSTLDISEAANG